MMNPKLSIIVPVYNVENYIEQCLISLYSSSADENDFEVIVVNDGTKDSSMEIVNRIADNHNNMHIFEQANGGLSVARNTGLAIANGDFVWFVDSDDWVTSNAVKKVIDIIQIEPDTDVLTFPLLWRFTDDSKNHIDIDINTDKYLTGVEYIRKIGVTGASPRNVIRKRILENADIKFLPGILHEDGLFGPQMYYQAKCVHLIAESLYNYRQRENGSIMHSLKIKSAYDLLQIYGKLMEYCDKDVLDDDKLWWRSKYISYFETAIAFTWHLRNTIEFKAFLKETSSYRKKECILLLNKKIGLRSSIKVILIGWFPLLYRRFILFYSKFRIK